MCSQQQQKRDQIVNYYNNVTKNLKTIAKLTKTSVRTVQRTIKRFNEQKSVNRKPGTGQKPKLSTADKGAICTIASFSPQLSCQKIATRMVQLGRPKVHRTTVNKVLSHYGFNYRLPRRAPLLTQAHIEKRLAWCVKYEHHDWSSTFFSDEASFQTFYNCKKYRSKTVRTISAPKFPAKVMVWGAFSARGKTPLFFTQKTVNWQSYCEIINGFLLETARVLYPEGYKLVQDNAPCHKAKKAMKFLDENSVIVLDWPPNSPDLNPIENIWGIIKVKLSSQLITDTSDLKTKIEKIWEEFDIDYLTPFIDSMPRRIQLCLEAKGKVIKY